MTKRKAADAVSRAAQPAAKKRKVAKRPQGANTVKKHQEVGQYMFRLRKRRIANNQQGSGVTELPDSGKRLEAKPTLLGLPGELRNHIYSFALIESHEIAVREDDSSGPGILQTCRQIRKEARPIFHRNNRFGVRIDDLKLGPQLGHWIWSDALVDVCSMRIRGVASWANLKAWLKACHGNRTIARPGVAAKQDAMIVVGMAFSLVEALDGVSWDIVEPALEAFKKALDAKRGTWNFR